MKIAYSFGGDGKEIATILPHFLVDSVQDFKSDNHVIIVLFLLQSSESIFTIEVVNTQKSLPTRKYG